MSHIFNPPFEMQGGDERAEPVALGTLLHLPGRAPARPGSPGWTKGWSRATMAFLRVRSGAGARSVCPHACSGGARRLPARRRPGK